MRGPRVEGRGNNVDGVWGRVPARAPTPLAPVDVHHVARLARLGRPDHAPELVAPEQVKGQVRAPRGKRVAKLGRAFKGDHDLGARFDQGVVRVAAQGGPLVHGVLDDERKDQRAVNVPD